jgi:hypothetical protein
MPVETEQLFYNVILNNQLALEISSVTPLATRCITSALGKLIKIITKLVNNSYFSFVMLQK